MAASAWPRRDRRSRSSTASASASRAPASPTDLARRSASRSVWARSSWPPDEVWTGQRRDATSTVWARARSRCRSTPACAAVRVAHRPTRRTRRHRWPRLPWMRTTPTRPASPSPASLPPRRVVADPQAAGGSSARGRRPRRSCAISSVQARDAPFGSGRRLRSVDAKGTALGVHRAAQRSRREIRRDHRRRALIHFVHPPPHLAFGVLAPVRPIRRHDAEVGRPLVDPAHDPQLERLEAVVFRADLERAVERHVVRVVSHGAGRRASAGRSMLSRARHRSRADAAVGGSMCASP